MSLTSWVTNILVGVLADQRVTDWIDQRITKALDAQRDALFAKIEASGTNIVNSVGSQVDSSALVVARNISALSQGMAGLSSSIVGSVIAQIKSIVPFHLLTGSRCPKCGHEFNMRTDYDNP